MRILFWEKRSEKLMKKKNYADCWEEILPKCFELVKIGKKGLYIIQIF